MSVMAKGLRGCLSSGSRGRRVLTIAAGVCLFLSVVSLWSLGTRVSAHNQRVVAIEESKDRWERHVQAFSQAPLRETTLPVTSLGAFFRFSWADTVFGTLGSWFPPRGSSGEVVGEAWSLPPMLELAEVLVLSHVFFDWSLMCVHENGVFRWAMVSQGDQGWVMTDHHSVLRPLDAVCVSRLPES